MAIIRNKPVTSRAERPFRSYIIDVTERQPSTKPVRIIHISERGLSYAQQRDIGKVTIDHCIQNAEPEP